MSQREYIGDEQDGIFFDDEAPRPYQEEEPCDCGDPFCNGDCEMDDLGYFEDDDREWPIGFN